MVFKSIPGTGVIKLDKIPQIMDFIKPADEQRWLYKNTGRHKEPKFDKRKIASTTLFPR